MGCRKPETRFYEIACEAMKADPSQVVFLDDLGEFGTTRFAIEEALKFHKAKPLSRQLEIETYTWDVLPAELKTGDIVDYVSRELEFVMKELQS